MIWELTEKHPIVDLSFFRNRNFTVGVLLTCVGYAVFFANVVILPLWLQTQLGYTATWAGLVQAPAGVMALLLSPFIGRLVNRVRRALVRLHRVHRDGVSASTCARSSTRRRVRRLHDCR